MTTLDEQSDAARAVAGLRAELARVDSKTSTHLALASAFAGAGGAGLWTALTRPDIPTTGPVGAGLFLAATAGAVVLALLASRPNLTGPGVGADDHTAQRAWLVQAVTRKYRLDQVAVDLLIGAVIVAVATIAVTAALMP